MRRDISTIRVAYRSRIRLLKWRIRNGKSIRRLARELGITHPTLSAILSNPRKAVSRKVMLKIIQKTTARKKRKPLISLNKGLRGWPVGDAV